ncbi:MAG TPA: response regulator [Candidatus Methylomirabilis sp.]|nr:response regulator [Candidatus Methylomirabilis sp.]
MGKSLLVYIVDDSAVQTEIAKALLEKAGHAVITNRSSADALRDIPARQPDCVLMDIMMPEVDGYELCRRLRGMPTLANAKLLMMSTKAYPFERKRAFELGANGYFTKPLHPASFAAQLERLVADTLTMTFWGVRGTLPISRKDSARYGGSTSCTSLDFPDGRLFVFDAGSGIKALSDALMAARRTRIDGKILISHPHWDHINALPFFAPFFVQGNQFEICGASHGDVSMRDLISAQMDGVYFPVTVREFAADVTYRDLGEGEFDVGGIAVRTMLLRHPGNCLGYRLRYAGRSICYVTDNELYDPDSEFYSDEYVERLADFARDADVLITDCCYTDEAYARKTNWGHSSVSQVADLTWRARPRTLYLIHHDPDDTDVIIDAKLAKVRELLAARGAATTVVAPVEHEEFQT